MPSCFLVRIDIFVAKVRADPIRNSISVLSPPEPQTSLQRKNIELGRREYFLSNDILQIVFKITAMGWRSQEEKRRNKHAVRATLT